MAYSRRGSKNPSNYTHEVGSLAVILSGKIAGTITIFRGGFARFSYAQDYDGPDISVNMPRSAGQFDDDVVRPWIEGLLPDNQNVRVVMAKEAGCSPNNPFDLLAHFGRDCPGAVQLCPPEDVASVIAREGSYEPVSETEIGRRLRESQSQTSPTWMATNEHWSLGGAQGKISLAKIDGHWNACHGSAATTHLLKPGVDGFSLQGLDEYLCMRLASACGLSVANTTYEEFDGTPAIVVERYDREALPNGTVIRLHQEDLCQAMGFLPSEKYVPSPSEIIAALRADSTGQSVDDFVSALFFNYLIGATDAHAKNYSLMHLSQDSLFLAPLYDVASILPYVKRKRGARVAAMPIGREKRFGRLTGSNIDRFARSNDLDARSCRELMARLATEVHDRVAQVVAESTHITGVERMGPNLERTVRANCEAMLLNMDKDGRSIDLSRVAHIDSGTLER